MKKTRTTIAITDTEIRLIQAERTRGKDAVTFCDIRHADGDSDDEIAGKLKSMVKLLPAEPGHPVLILPRRAVILRQLKLPFSDPRELQDMIGLQLLNNIPYPVEDMIYQHCLLEKSPDGWCRVLVAIVHKDVSLRYCRILQKAGIKEAKFILDSFGIFGWLDYREKTGQMETGYSSIALINVDAQHIEICFCCREKLVYSRRIPYGSECLISGDSAELVHQIRLSLTTYNRKCFGTAVEKIVILAAPDDGKMLKKRLEKFITMPIEILNPLEGAFCLPAMDKSSLQGRRPSSITADLGFLFSDAGHLINLTPKEVHEEKRKVVMRRKAVKLAALVFVVVVLSALSQSVAIQKKNVSLQALESELSRLAPRLNDAARKGRIVKYFDEKIKEARFIPDLIDELGRLTPEDVSFRVVVLDKTRLLTIRGYAGSHARINDLKARLIQSARFLNADLKFATNRKIANMPVMDFEIVSQLNDNIRDGL